MNEKQTLPEETLALISRRIPGASSDHELVQHTLRSKLHKTMRSARTQPQRKQVADFGSAWLPGPLSYPWLLMFAGIPRFLEHLLKQT